MEKTPHVDLVRHTGNAIQKLRDAGIQCELSYMGQHHAILRVPLHFEDGSPHKNLELIREQFARKHRGDASQLLQLFLREKKNPVEQLETTLYEIEATPGKKIKVSGKADKVQLQALVSIAHIGKRPDPEFQTILDAG